jgi:hypothetical protein
MESSSPSGSTNPNINPTFGRFLGVFIAILTLTLPLFVISNYSSNSTLTLSQELFSEYIEYNHNANQN